MRDFANAGYDSVKHLPSKEQQKGAEFSRRHWMLLFAASQPAILPPWKRYGNVLNFNAICAGA